jgi:hypothetical protein
MLLSEALILFISAIILYKKNFKSYWLDKL